MLASLQDFNARQCGFAGEHLLGPSLQICHPAMFCMHAGSFLGVAGLVVGKWQAIATATAVAFRTFGGPSFFGSVLRTPGKPADLYETPAAVWSLLDTSGSLLAAPVLELTSLGCLEARQTKRAGSSGLESTTWELLVSMSAAHLPASRHLAK